jgi:hypothetical protein
LNNFEAFQRHFQRNYDALEDVFREIEALMRNLRLFEDIFNGIEAFFEVV